MLTRVLPVGAAAAFVLVAGPGLAVRTIHPAGSGTVVTTVTAPPGKPAASLKIGVTRAGSAAKPLVLHILAAGHVPTKSTTLVDDSGVHGAEATTTATGCASAKPYETGIGKADWCVSVVGVPAGHTVSGELDGGTTLTLSLTRRHAFLPWPLIVLLAGLVTPLLTGMFMKKLNEVAGSSEAADLVDANENQRNKRLRISGLREWAKDHESDADRLAMLQRIVSGPTQIRRAQRRLARSLSTTSLPRGHAYVVAAWRVARRPTIQVEDIVNDDGTPRVARAAEYLAQLAPLEADHDALVGLQHALTNITGNHAFDAHRAVDVLAERFERVATPEDVASLVNPLIDALGAVDAAGQVPDVVLETIRGRDSGAEAAGAETGALARALESAHTLTADPLDLSGPDLLAEEGTWSLLTWGAVGVVLAFAGLTVAKSAYLSNPTFATRWDYFALFSAALASGAAATVLGLLHTWHPDETATPA